MSKNLVEGKIFVPGGILSPGDLRRLAATANHFDVPYLSLGNRQELYFQVDQKYEKDIAVRYSNTQYNFEIRDFNKKNIISSYAMRNLVSGTKWLSSGVYREALSTFKNIPEVTVNICEPTQGMFALFSSQLNFIASEYENYWHLYVKLQPEHEAWKWPVLVDSKEIALLSEEVEKVLKSEGTVSKDELVASVYESRDWTFRNSDDEPDLSPKRFFYYEGLHPMYMHEKRYWIGIYERLNEYPVKFLEALAMVCNQTDIGTVNITPYKSIIIKNIAEKDIPLWESLLGRFKINTCHSSLEVNFRVPDLDKNAFKIRKQIFDYFDNREVRSDGLVFAINEHDAAANVFVEEKFFFSYKGYNAFPYYNIKHKKDFNNNSHETITVSEFIKRRDVPEVLTYLCEEYYKQLNQKQKEGTSDSKIRKVKESKDETEVFFCKHCLTTYNQKYGDSLNSIAAGIPFSSLPDNFCCPVCEAPKNDYLKVDSGEVPA